MAGWPPIHTPLFIACPTILVWASPGLSLAPGSDAPRALAYSVLPGGSLLFFFITIVDCFFNVPSYFLVLLILGLALMSWWMSMYFTSLERELGHVTCFDPQDASRYNVLVLFLWTCEERFQSTCWS